MGMVLWIVWHRVEHSAEGVELTLHHRSIPSYPSVDLGERLDADAVVTKASICSLFDQSGALQDCELLADRGLRDVDRSHQVGDVAFSERERVEQRAARRRRDGV